jgi:hypothetical protein
MGLQVGNKSAGRSVLLRFFLYPAVANIPGEIIFYRDLHISNTRGWGLKNHFFFPRACEHTSILRALVEHPQGHLEEIQQNTPAEHPGGTCRPSGPQGLDVRHRALHSQPCTASADAGGAIRMLVPVTSPPRPPPERANVPTYDSWGKQRL